MKQDAIKASWVTAMAAAWMAALFSLAAAASDGEPGFPRECGDTRAVLNQARAQSYWSPQRGSCMLSVDSLSSFQSLVYRSYLFNEDGLFMVFNSFGEGPDALFTGARDYYLFPRKGMPVFRHSAEETLDVRLANGNVMVFDSFEVSPRSFEGAELSVAPEVRRDNNGGIEIRLQRGLMLDCGFALGAQPESKPSRKSVFRDYRGAECAVENQEVFEYLPEGEFRIRHRTDEELARFLERRCPALDVSSLRTLTR